MISKLESVLVQDIVAKGNVCNNLFDYLGDGVSLYCLRAASRTLKYSLNVVPERLWGTLHLHAPVRMTDRIFTLEHISSSCHTLTIRVRIPDRKADNEPRSLPAGLRGISKSNGRASPSASSTREIVWPQDLGAYEVDRQLWTYIFKRFKNLQSLTLCVDGDPAWSGRGEVEHTLTSLRCALERAKLCNLRSLFLSPIHICGILHLHWHGFGALYEVATPRTCAELWQSIALLDIQLSSPVRLTDAQRAMSIKVLQSYLRSFAPTLRCLLFVWLDGDGPSPILLDDGVGMESIQRLYWPQLEELYLGNIITVKRTLQAIPDCAPNVKVVKVLRSTHRFSRIEAGDSEAWIELGVEMNTDPCRQMTDSVTSSFYSQDGVRV